MSDTSRDVSEMVIIYARIRRTLRARNPGATEEQLDKLCREAMEHALGLSSRTFADGTQT